MTTKVDPKVIDNQLAHLFNVLGKLENEIKAQMIRGHYALGLESTRVNKVTVWPITLRSEMIRRLEEAAKTHTEHFEEYCYLCPVKPMNALKEQVRSYEQTIKGIDSLEDVWAAHRWSRFFLVTSSNGHIHRNRSCSTCFSTTEYGWLPALSGESEAQAVAVHGALLCTVCYPSAPVEWTNGEKPKKEGECDGGQATNVKWRYSGRTYTGYGDCPSCPGRMVVKQNGQMKKHKIQKAS